MTDPAPTVPGRRLLVVSPAKNEDEYLERTIESLAAQVLRPTLWIIVDDGSTDRTGALADGAAQRHEWIKVVHRPQATERRVGPGVIEAFYAGLETVDLAGYDYVCKLDADLVVPPRYFAELIRRFEANPRLGTASGKIYTPIGDKVLWERTSDDLSVGAAKLYRRECFNGIGGFVREVMWDGIDCHRCRMLGWQAASYPDPELSLCHLRLMGSSHQSIYHGRRRGGRGQYFMGTHPLYFLAIVGYRLADRPRVLGALHFLFGYLAAWWQGAARYDDPAFRRHLRSWQLRELLRRLTGRSQSSTARPRAGLTSWARNLSRLGRNRVLPWQLVMSTWTMLGGEGGPQAAILAVVADLPV